MANVQIKSEERRQQEAAVLRSYGVSGRTPEQREAAAVIVARSQEAMKEGKKYGY